LGTFPAGKKPDRPQLGLKNGALNGREGSDEHDADGKTPYVKPAWHMAWIRHSCAVCAN